MAGFDIDLYDDVPAATRALTFVRNGLLFAGFTGCRFEWPVELDLVPELVAAELVGYDNPDSGRVHDLAVTMGCPATREFVDLVMAGAQCDVDFLENAIGSLSEYGTAGSGEMDDETMRALRIDPTALYAAALVSDAVVAVRAAGPNIRFVMSGSRAFATIMQMAPAAASEEAPSVGRHF